MPVTRNQKTRRATLKDVASAAGVSMQTVSRVVNESPLVAPKTVKRVTKIMEELGYQPNTAARMLQTQRSHTLEVVAIDLPLLPAPLVQMGNRARQNGYHMIFTSGEERELDSILESMISRLVDGFILIAPRMHDAHEKLAIDIPFVSMLMGAIEGQWQLNSVIFDQEYGMRLLVEHLLACGHRQIAEICGPRNHEGGRSRHEAWIRLAKEYGLEPGPSVAVEFSMEGGFVGMDTLLGVEQPFTAIIAGNDDIALGALHRLQQTGIRVPTDLAIVGFDDAPHAAYISPPLTTIRQDFYKLGDIATDYLISLIEDDQPLTYQRVLKPELIVRASTSNIT